MHVGNNPKALLTVRLVMQAFMRQLREMPYGQVNVAGICKQAGVSRQAFQDSLEKYLKDVCKPWGVSLNSVLIRDIFAPQEVAAIIRQRELAGKA